MWGTKLYIKLHICKIQHNWNHTTEHSDDSVCHFSSTYIAKSVCTLIQQKLEACKDCVWAISNTKQCELQAQQQGCLGTCNNPTKCSIASINQANRLDNTFYGGHLPFKLFVNGSSWIRHKKKAGLVCACCTHWNTAW